MKKTIWKYPINQSNFMDLPAGAEVVSVGLDPSGVACLWVMVDPGEKRLVARLIVVVGTGWDIPADCRYLGRFNEGVYVWHVIELV